MSFTDVETVRVTATYLRSDGSPQTGVITFAGPPVLLLPDNDTMVIGAKEVELDANGSLTVDLVATDATGINPTGWAYYVTENFPAKKNLTYSILLPKVAPHVDLADLHPVTEVQTNYLPVTGPPGTPEAPLIYAPSAPASSWTINHNFGNFPSISVYDDAGNELLAEVTNPDIYTTIVLFANPVTGKALLRR